MKPNQKNFLCPLQTSGQFKCDFVGRLPGIPTSRDKSEILARAAPWHDDAARKLGFTEKQVHLAEQNHGRGAAVIHPASPALTPGADALAADSPGVLLGIHVADCGALYLADPRSAAFGLVHSGKKGSELNITVAAIRAMEKHFGSRPADLIAVLAPCIRPPHYEIDFAAEIRRQALDCGIKPENYHDCGLCTASDPQAYYSYRREKGKTGRMIALLGRAAS